MAAVAKIHAARQPPIPLKPFIEYHHYPTPCVATQFETLTGTGTATKTVTCKRAFLSPLTPPTMNASSALLTTSKKHRTQTS
mmetsp:Transcript_22968/g.48898  ORF Transcript_22968/g.48898 Transcript_22968/m.48898 type:complete len:82 (+) Transcript_22968:74-319(+)